MNGVLTLGAAEVDRLISLADAFEAARQALEAHSAGQTVSPLRTATPLPGGGLLGLMPGSFGKYFGAKVISLPAHEGAVLLFDSRTGALLASVDGARLTALRTAAASALATRLLARPDADVLGVVGAGTQAEAHIRALARERKLRRVRLFGRDAAKARALAARLSSELGLEIEAVAAAREASRGAGIVCVVTSSRTAVLEDGDVDEGAHVNAVGACRAPDRELSSELVASSRIFADSLRSLRHESGDFLIPLREGRLRADHLAGELGSVSRGELVGRRSRLEITLFKSLGLAVEDLALAARAYEKHLEVRRWSRSQESSKPAIESARMC